MAVSTLKIPDTQPFKEISVTPATNVVIDVNKSYRRGKYGMLIVKGHATANVTNTTIFTVDSADEFEVGWYTCPIGLGTEWDVTATGYGYVGSNTFASRVQSGQYFHINIPMIFK